MASIQRKGNSWRAQVCRHGRRSSKVFPTEALARAWAQRQECAVAGMPALRESLADHNIVPLLPKKFLEAVNSANYTESEILSCAFPIHLDSGVYFLIRNSEITYVGQTTNVLRRILKHRESGRRFDSFAFIPCLPENLDELERVYIRFLMPDENQKGI